MKLSRCKKWCLVVALMLVSTVSLLVGAATIFSQAHRSAIADVVSDGWEDGVLPGLGLHRCALHSDVVKAAREVAPSLQLLGHGDAGGARDRAAPSYRPFREGAAAGWPCSALGGSNGRDVAGGLPRWLRQAVQHVHRTAMSTLAGRMHETTLRLCPASPPWRPSRPASSGAAEPGASRPILTAAQMHGAEPLPAGYNQSAWTDDDWWRTISSDARCPPDAAVCYCTDEYATGVGCTSAGDFGKSEWFTEAVAPDEGSRDVLLRTRSDSCLMHIEEPAITAVRVHCAAPRAVNLSPLLEPQPRVVSPFTVQQQYADAEQWCAEALAEAAEEISGEEGWQGARRDCARCYDVRVDCPALDSQELHGGEVPAVVGDEERGGVLSQNGVPLQAALVGSNADVLFGLQHLEVGTPVRPCGVSSADLQAEWQAPWRSPGVLSPTVAERVVPAVAGGHAVQWLRRQAQSDHSDAHKDLLIASPEPMESVGDDVELHLRGSALGAGDGHVLRVTASPEFNDGGAVVLCSSDTVGVRLRENADHTVAVGVEQLTTDVDGVCRVASDYTAFVVSTTLIHLKWSAVHYHLSGWYSEQSRRSAVFSGWNYQQYDGRYTRAIGDALMPLLEATMWPFPKQSGPAAAAFPSSESWLLNAPALELAVATVGQFPGHPQFLEDVFDMMHLPETHPAAAALSSLFEGATSVDDAFNDDTVEEWRGGEHDDDGTFTAVLKGLPGYIVHADLDSACLDRDCRTSVTQSDRTVFGRTFRLWQTRIMMRVMGVLANDDEVGPATCSSGQDGAVVVPRAWLVHLPWKPREILPQNYVMLSDFVDSPTDPLDILSEIGSATAPEALDAFLAMSHAVNSAQMTDLFVPDVRVARKRGACGSGFHVALLDPKLARCDDLCVAALMFALREEAAALAARREGGSSTVSVQHDRPVALDSSVAAVLPQLRGEDGMPVPWAVALDPGQFSPREAWALLPPDHAAPLDDVKGREPADDAALRAFVHDTWLARGKEATAAFNLRRFQAVQPVMMRLVLENPIAAALLDVALGYEPLDNV